MLKARCAHSVFEGVTHDRYVPEIQNDPYFIGNSGHFDKFHPLFSREIGENWSHNPMFLRIWGQLSFRTHIHWESRPFSPEELDLSWPKPSTPVNHPVMASVHGQSSGSVKRRYGPFLAVLGSTVKPFLRWKVLWSDDLHLTFQGYFSSNSF